MPSPEADPPRPDLDDLLHTYPRQRVPAELRVLFHAFQEESVGLPVQPQPAQAPTGVSSSAMYSLHDGDHVEFV